MEIEGRIRSLGPAAAAGTGSERQLHGIEFDATDPRILLLIYELQNSRGGSVD